MATRGQRRGSACRWPRSSALDRVLVVGSFLRKDHPLIAQRLRQAAKKGTQVSMLHSVDDDWLLRVAHKAIVAPSQLPAALAGIVVAAAQAPARPFPRRLPASSRRIGEGDRREPPVGQEDRDPARQLCDAARGASQLHALAQLLAELTGATLGFLTEAANTVGAHLAGALPQSGGMNAQAMLADPRQRVPRCCTPSRSSISPMPSRRARRWRRPTWSS